jgi:hypothetical protein
MVLLQLSGSLEVTFILYITISPLQLRNIIETIERLWTRYIHTSLKMSEDARVSAREIRADIFLSGKDS